MPTSKPMLRGDRCQCSACGEYFNSTSMFDRHRVGRYPVRRCLTPDEMAAKGYVRNGTGFWTRSAMPAVTGREIIGAANDGN